MSNYDYATMLRSYEYLSPVSSRRLQMKWDTTSFHKHRHAVSVSSTLYHVLFCIKCTNSEYTPVIDNWIYVFSSRTFLRRHVGKLEYWFRVLPSPLSLSPSLSLSLSLSCPSICFLSQQPKTCHHHFDYVHNP